MSAQPGILEDYIARYSRWGRWGPDDQLGATNLVGPEQVRAAAALVRDGQVISLTMPYDQTGPQRGGLRSNPRLITTATGTDVLAGAQDRLGLGSLGFADDMVIMGTQTGTQWDALSHIFHKGRMWNGYSAAEHTSAGAARNGIQHWSDRLVMRAVLVDLPVLRGVPALDDGYPITAGDIEEALAATGAGVQPGDALAVRTGQLAARRGRWVTDRGRRRARPVPVHRPVAVREQYRRGGHRHLRGGGQPQRDRRIPAAAPGRHRPHGPGARRDLRPGRTVGSVRRRRQI